MKYFRTRHSSFCGKKSGDKKGNNYKNNRIHEKHKLRLVSDTPRTLFKSSF